MVSTGDACCETSLFVGSHLMDQVYSIFFRKVPHFHDPVKELACMTHGVRQNSRGEKGTEVMIYNTSSCQLFDQVHSCFVFYDLQQIDAARVVYCLPRRNYVNPSPKKKPQTQVAC